MLHFVPVTPKILFSILSFKILAYIWLKSLVSELHMKCTSASIEAHANLKSKQYPTVNIWEPPKNKDAKIAVRNT